MSEYLGISYEITDVTGVSLPDKIIPLNNSYYNLIDAHRIDWNETLLPHTEDIPAKYVSEFFEVDPEDEDGKRMRYKNMPNLTGIKSTTYNEWPSWFNNKHIYNTGDMADLTDYLCFATSKAFELIDKIYEALNNEKLVLEHVDAEIIAYDSKVDKNGDVYSFPIKFEIKPNQNIMDFVSETNKPAYYKNLESRKIRFTLLVKTESGAPVNDSTLFINEVGDAVLNTNKTDLIRNGGFETPNGIKISALYSVVETAAFGTGCFIVEMDLAGWPVQSQFRASKINIVNTRWSTNSLENYKNDDTKIIDFESRTPQSDKYMSSDIRTTRLSLSKAENTFDIFINDRRYVYIPENFFVTGKYQNYNSGPDGKPAVYILSTSLLDSEEDIKTLDYKYFEAHPDLLTSLIPVTNHFFGSAYDSSRTCLNVANDNYLSIEVYPKFFGSVNNIPKDDKTGKYLLPGGYDKNSDINVSLQAANFKDQYLNTTNDFIIPIWCWQRDGSVRYNDSITITPDINTTEQMEVSGNTYAKYVCTQKITKEIDGVERTGFKFRFKIASSKIADITAYNKDKQGNFVGYFDIYFGTTASKFVASNFLKLRLLVNNRTPIYFVDNNNVLNQTTRGEESLAKTTIGGSFNGSVLSVTPKERINNETKEPISPIGLLSKNYEYLLEKSTITKTGNNPFYDYVWDLELPIFANRSWTLEVGKDPMADLTTNNEKESKANEIGYTVIYPTLIKGGLTASDGSGKLENPNGRNSLPKTWEDNNTPYTKYKYNNGFPSLLISTGIDSTETDDRRRLIKAMGYASVDTKYYDLSDEIVIDYAKTYQANKDGFCSLLLPAGDIKKAIDSAKTDKERGIALCKFFVGINKSGSNKYLTFIHPTIPDNEACYKTYFNGEENNAEWEDLVRSGGKLREKIFKLVLSVPELTATGSSDKKITHYEANITVYCNIRRANRDFAGWARRPKENNRGIGEQLTLRYNDTRSFQNIISDQKISLTNSIITVTRNTGKVIVCNDMNDGTVPSFSTRINSSQYFVDKFDIVSDDGIVRSFWIKQNNTDFTIYASEEETTNTTTESIAKVSEARYMIDDISPFSLKFWISGDEWYRGFNQFPNGSSLGNYRTIDTVLYRQYNNKISFKNSLSTPNSASIADGIRLPAMLVQNIDGDTVDGTIYDSGQYIYSTSNERIQIKRSEFLNTNFDVMNLSIFNFGDNDYTDQVAKIYGDNWKSEFLKLSITVGIGKKQTKYEYSEDYKTCLNRVRGGLNKESMNLFVTYNNSLRKYSWNFDYGFNYIHVGNTQVIYGMSTEDIPGTPAHFINCNNGQFSFSENIKSNATFEVGDHVGMCIVALLPMTNKYRGKIYAMSIDFELT